MNHPKHDPYEQGFRDACRVRWELDAHAAFVAGFLAAFDYDPTAANTDTAEDVWINYHVALRKSWKSYFHKASLLGNPEWFLAAQEVQDTLEDALLTLEADATHNLNHWNAYLEGTDS